LTRKGNQNALRFGFRRLGLCPKRHLKGFLNQNRFAVLIRARDRSGNTADFTEGKVEELERIARSPPQAGMRPY
jgi:hypothetical protein